MPMRRDVTATTLPFTFEGMTFPGSTSTVLSHRTTAYAPTLNFSYQTPIWLANTPIDFAGGLRFGGYATGWEREEEFGSRFNTSGSWIINPYVQLRPRIANWFAMYLEAGAWIDDNCFFEDMPSSDLRFSVNGYAAAPEFGVGLTVPLPWTSYSNIQFDAGLHWIGSSSVSRTLPIFGIDEKFTLDRHSTVAGTVGFGIKF